jgi:hypothetical protein
MKNADSGSPATEPRTTGAEEDSLQEAIRKVAYSIYCESGGHSGNELEHWLLAEQIVRARRKGTAHPSVPSVQADPE